MAKLPGISESPELALTPHGMIIKTGIVSPCTGCRNNSLIDNNTINLGRASSPICPRKLNEFRQENPEFLEPRELVGLPVNPVFDGRTYYTWVARKDINAAENNPEFDTLKIKCESLPYILFSPERDFDFAGHLQQNDELFLIPGEVLLNGIKFDGLAIPAELATRKRIEVEKAIAGVTSGLSGV